MLLLPAAHPPAFPVRALLPLLLSAFDGNAPPLTIILCVVMFLLVPFVYLLSGRLDIKGIWFDSQERSYRGPSR